MGIRWKGRFGVRLRACRRAVLVCTVVIIGATGLAVGSDGISLSVSRGSSSGVTLSWTGGNPPYYVYRSSQRDNVRDPANLIAQTNGLQWDDDPAGNAYYAVVGTCIPETEVCDGVDNNCDGMIDEGFNPPTAIACWENDAGLLVCDDPNTDAVAPLATVQLDGRMSVDPDGQALQYSWRLASAPDGSTTTISNPNSAMPSLFVPLAGDYRVCLTVTDTTACESDEACTTIHAVPTAGLHVEMVWDTDETDVDLHFMQDGIDQAFTCPADCHFVCPTPDWGAPGSANNPSLDLDDAFGYGPENTNFPEPFDGRFVIAVHYWCDHAAGNPPIGDTTVTVRLYLDQDLVATWSRSLSNHDLWYVADLDWVSGSTQPLTITAQDTVQAFPAGCP